MSPLTLREARDSDEAGLIALIGGVFDEYPGCVTDVDGEMPELRRIQSAFQAWGGRFWVAERADRLVGCIGCTPATDPAGVELKKLYVHASERQSGLGATLMQRVLAEAVERGAAFVDLWSDTRFETAHRFYQARGFVRAPTTRELHDRSHTVEYHFRRDLPGPERFELVVTQAALHVLPDTDNPCGVAEGEPASQAAQYGPSSTLDSGMRAREACGAPKGRSEPAGPRNLAVLRRTLGPLRGRLLPGDIAVLPERWYLGHDAAGFEAAVTALATWLGCAVVGGSHHEVTGERAVHRGLAADHRGRVVGAFEKLRPYAAERAAVAPGQARGELVLAGRPASVAICADFWFSDLLLAAEQQPEVMLVPALSVSRKATPDYSRALWRHLAVTRAYEFGAVVAISDWSSPRDVAAGALAGPRNSPRDVAAGALGGPPVDHRGLAHFAPSGVAGIADPSEVEAELLFRAAPAEGTLSHTVDLARLRAFRADRRERGFFWEPRERAGRAPPGPASAHAAAAAPREGVDP